jgi:stalled ribosome rescue protein Dom34
MELTNNTIVETSIVSEFTHEEKELSLRKNENLMHNKEQQQSSYYKKLGSAIKNSQEVVLFGPTSAKNELLNLLKADHLFENIKIEVKHSDKMTKAKMHDFVL